MPKMGAKLMKTLSRRSLYVIIALAIVILLPVVYFFVLRTPDSNYQAAIDQIANLQDSTKKIDGELSITTYVAAVDSTTLDNIRSASDEFDKLSDFSDSIVATDSVVNQTYKQYRDQITTYSTQIDNLVAGIDTYLAIVDTCQTATGNIPQTTTAATFDTATKDCSDKIDSLTDVPSSNFKNDFLTPYAAAVTDYVTALKRYTTTTTKQSSESAVTRAYTKIITLGNQTIDYGIAPLKSEVFDALRSVIVSQKSALLR